MQRLVPVRDSSLQQEMAHQQNNERLRRQFAQKANLVGQWIERHLDAVASIGVQKGSLEDHLNKLKGVEKEVGGGGCCVTLRTRNLIIGPTCLIKWPGKNNFLL